MSELQRMLSESGVDGSTLRPWRETDRGIVWTMQCAGGQAAVDLWRRLRALVEQSGHWPVILGNDEALAQHEEAFELPDAASVSDTLAAAAELSGPAVLQARMADAAELLVEPDVDEEWPDEPQPAAQFQIPFDILTNTAYPLVHVALVPTRVAWEVPAFLQTGGWNECPAPAEHCAMLRYWHEGYGAEVVGMTPDTIEMHVPRPPADRQAALKLATEQYIYCVDIVEQGVGSVSALAAALLDSPIWYFWWD